MKRWMAISLCCLIGFGLSGCYSKEMVDESVQEFIDIIENNIEIDAMEEEMNITVTAEAVASTEDKETVTTEATTIESEEDFTTEAMTEENEANEADNSEIAAQSDEGWKAAYQNKVNELLADDNMSLGILLVDLDRDEIPEMIVSSLGVSDMYTYSDGQLIALGYEYAFYTSSFHYQNDTLIAESHGLDCLVGMDIDFATKEGTQLIEERYSFYWDENYNPIVHFYDRFGNETLMDYGDACAELNELGIYVSYEMKEIGQVDQNLEYTVTYEVAKFEMDSIQDTYLIEEKIRTW